MKNVRNLAHQDYLAGMRYKDIAEKHGVKESTIRSWVNRYWKESIVETPLQQTATNVATEAKTLQQNKAVSWTEIENEYMTDISRKPCTLKDLADKYNIPYRTIRDYAAKNNWAKKRTNFKHSSGIKAAEKTAALIGEDIAKANSRHYELSNRILDSLSEALKDDRELFKYVETLRAGEGPGAFTDTLTVEILPALNSKKLAEITKALKDNQDIQRKALGILSPLEEHKIDHDKKKIELERQKTEQSDSKTDELITDWFSSITEGDADIDG